ncbi:MAG: hypothetical protein E7369_01090 [Clostridiales bacterium]|nr:hypothetical protein [Clostridiales bacterium]
MNFFKWLFSKFKKPRPLKLGLALGSGGAKGFAELGVIKAMEENGIEFDIVAGTSIGSIIGAFYADGYTSTDIYELFKKVDFMKIISPPMLKMDTSGLKTVIDRAIGGKNIEELKKPFMAVATEVESGEEMVFKSGSVSTALSASSCFPPFFKPVVIDDKRYLDGAFTNSIPADLVREMGADYVVGVDLSDRDAKPNLLFRIIPTYESKIKEPWKKGYTNSDFMLHPDLTGYSSVSFLSGSQIYEIGYRTAIENMPKIKAEIEKLKKKKR